MNCTNCGAVLAPGTTTCPNCGTVLGTQQPVTNEQPVQQPVSMPVQQPAEQAVMPAGMPQPSPIPVQQQPAPQPAVGGIIPNQQPGNSGSKKGIIAVLLIVLALVVGVGGYFIYDGIQEKKAEEKREEKKKEENSNDNQTDYYDYKKYEEEIKNGVSAKQVKKFDDGSLLLLVENKSSRVAGVDVEIEFYDASNQILGTDVVYVNVAPNSERYALVSKYSVKEGYVDIKLNLSTIDYTEIMDLKDLKESDLIKNELEDEIILQYKNNTEYDMDFEVVAIFYSNNEIVYADYETDSFVEAGQNANLEIDLYYLEEITYDRYELHAYAEYDTYDG